MQFPHTGATGTSPSPSSNRPVTTSPATTAAATTHTTTTSSSTWGASVIGALARGLRSARESFASTTTTRGPALGERSVQVGKPGAKEAGDTKASIAKDRQDAKQDGPPTLETVWPGHAWTRGPVESLCQALIEQNGDWQEQAIYKALAKLTGEQLEEAGEFAALLQAHHALRGKPLLSKVLAEVGIPPSWPVSALAGVNPGLGHVRFLATGLARGLMRTHQTFSLTRFLQAASDPNAHDQLEPVAAVAVALRNAVSDQGLRDVLGAVHGLPLAEKGSLMRQVRVLAQSDSVALTDLHRLVRMASFWPRTTSQVAGDLWYCRWLRILERPAEGEGEIARERQFVLGHAAALGCRDFGYAKPYLQAVLDGKHPAPATRWDLPPPALAPAQPTPSARAGILWAEDPKAQLASLHRDPDAAMHLTAWLALRASPLASDAVGLYRQVEALPLAFGERYRLQRVILRQEGAFAAVRDSVMAQAPTTTAASSSSTTTTSASLDETPSATASPPADEGAAHISRLTDLFRYFGEREGLEFAFEGEPDLARIRGADAQVRERIAFIEAAIWALQALAPAARPGESSQAAFLREGLQAVAKVTLGASLELLQANHARAQREAGLDVKAGPHRPATQASRGTG